MKKTKLTRSLMAAVSVVALSAVMYGCVHSGDDPVAEPPPPPIDSDGDGVSDADDAFPMDPDETADFDGDGVGDNADPDDDNDGVADVHDALPMNSMETADTDMDGVGNNADLDDDNDGVIDADDAFPLDAAETMDSDGDGVGDNADAFPMDAAETMDSDGDGTGDYADAFPMDAAETMDSDGDGVGDNADAFPMDAAETMDSDGDGVGDMADAFPMDASETMDSDGDGVGDMADAFPMDAMETMDSDGDGVGDMADAFPMDAMETMDSDGDGTGDNADAFPMDAMETMDSDGDMVGDNADAFPMDATETMDSDGDMVGDNADAFPMDATETMDSDGDSVGDNADAFPMDRTEWADADGDGRGDNMYPPDRDGDGVPDVADRFPDDPEETSDFDGDGVGDNADAFPMDAAETMDSDGDGLGDNADPFPGHHPSLLKTANAYDITSAPTGLTLDETRQREVDSIGAAIAGVAAATAADRAGTSTTASVTWPGDVADDPGTAATDESMMGMLGITVNAGGTEIVAAFEAVAAADNDGTAVVQTATRISGLDDTFTQGFDIWEDDGNPTETADQARAIVFTNKTQDDPAVEAADAVIGVNLDNVMVAMDQVVELGTKSGNNYMGAMYDHDNDDATDPIEGTLICHMPTECSVSMDGEDLTVTGYHFTGMREGKDAVPGMDAAAQAAANDYLVLGIWLDEDTNGDDTFGAFATGSTNYQANVGNVITGEATYRGSAFGAHHISRGPVSYFDGSATLVADFGADDAPGTINGTINNINVNGAPYGHSITLSTAALTNANAAFNGRAVMGPQKEPGSQDHLFNGTWDGNFYGASAEVVADPDNNIEAVAAGARAPGAVAGTFGVTRSDTTGMGADAVTTVESFVGAFGAHKDD